MLRNLVPVATWFLVAATARAQAVPELELPSVVIEPAGALALERATADVVCAVAAERSLVTCSIEQRYTVVGASEREARGATQVRGDATIACHLEEVVAGAIHETPVDCGAFTLPAGEELVIELRAERSFVPRFERRWVHDPNVAVVHPHASDPIPNRHLLTSRNGGFGRVAPVTVVFRRPRGVATSDEAHVWLHLGGHALFDGRYGVEHFGRHSALARDGRIRTSILGGPTLALGGVRRSGIATRIGYEVGFARDLPMGLELAHEWSPERGHAVAATVFVSSAGIFGGALGVGPVVRFDEGTTTGGARLALDVMFVSAHFLTLLTFERDAKVSVGFHLGLTL